MKKSFEQGRDREKGKERACVWMDDNDEGDTITNCTVAICTKYNAKRRQDEERVISSEYMCVCMLSEMHMRMYVHNPFLERTIICRFFKEIISLFVYEYRSLGSCLPQSIKQGMQASSLFHLTRPHRDHGSCRASVISDHFL